MPSPNIQGFIEAQNTLRQEFGVDVVFDIPVAPVYAPTVPIDPETGLPYDPTVVPTSGGGTTQVTILGLLVRQALPTNEQDEVTWSQSGVRRTDMAVLSIDPVDRPTIEGATSFTVQGIPYSVTDMTPDGIVDIDRWLVFGEAK